MQTLKNSFENPSLLFETPLGVQNINTPKCFIDMQQKRERAQKIQE